MPRTPPPTYETTLLFSKISKEKILMSELPQSLKDVVLDYVKRGILKVNAKTGIVTFRTADWRNAYKLKRLEGDIPSKTYRAPITSW